MQGTPMPAAPLLSIHNSPSSTYLEFFMVDIQTRPFSKNYRYVGLAKSYELYPTDLDFAVASSASL